MTALTENQLREAKIRLAMILEGKRLLDAHVEVRDLAQPVADDDEEAQGERLGQTMFWYVVSQMLQAQTDELADFMGVSSDAEDRLAEVIDIFDGNRRMGRTR